MREIKFRVWNKINNTMIQWYNIYSLYTRINEVNPIGIVVSAEERGSGESRKIINIILMQYTGLTDKNGKEIYEGDIVELPWVDLVGNLHWEAKEKEHYCVEFKHGTFAITKLHINQPLRDWCRKKTGEYIPNKGQKLIVEDIVECKIIGNIHETPELLTAE